MQNQISLNSSTPEPDIVIYTDGSCRKNPGPAGSAAVIFYGDDDVVAISKYIGDKSTNNKSEICAIKIALEHVKESGKLKSQVIHIYSDSSYALNVVAGQYRSTKNKWLITKTRDLMLEALSGKGIRMFFVRGHSGYEWNEVCDVLANLASFNPGMDQTERLDSLEELRESTSKIKEQIDNAKRT